MYKLFSLVIVLVAYVPLSVFADAKLQQFQNVVSKMNSAILCNYTCVPNSWNDSDTLYLSFQTTIDDDTDPDDVYECMVDYMASAVGDATSNYTVTGDVFEILFTGQYDPNLVAPGPLQALATELQYYGSPDVGGWICSPYIFESLSGFIYIALTAPTNGTNYESVCSDIYNYLRGNGYLDDQSIKKFSYIQDSDSAFVEVWSTQ